MINNKSIGAVEMDWAKEKPTSKGWYWRKQRNIKPHCVNVYFYPGYESDVKALIVYDPIGNNTDEPVDIDQCEGDWAGPIQEPNHETN